MPLDAAQKDTIAEITQETYETIDSLVSSLNFNSDQEDRIAADVVTWNLKRNSIAALDGDLKWKAETLLDRIRQRTRKAFGLPLYSEEVHQTSGALANRFVF